MVVVKFKNGTKKKIGWNKDIFTEFSESHKLGEGIDQVFISRKIITLDEKEKEKLKEVCTKYGIEVEPLNRHFTKHRIFIKEDNLEEAFMKLILVKKCLSGKMEKKHGMTTKDYIYCEDCKEYVDLWRYDHNIKDCGHETCKWRYVTEEELIGCTEDCKRFGCYGKS